MLGKSVIVMAAAMSVSCVTWSSMNGNPRPVESRPDALYQVWLPDGIVVMKSAAWQGDSIVGKLSACVQSHSNCRVAIATTVVDSVKAEKDLLPGVVTVGIVWGLVSIVGLLLLITPAT